MVVEKRIMMEDRKCSEGVRVIKKLMDSEGGGCGVEEF
jgi:hypothetical protein